MSFLKGDYETSYTKYYKKKKKTSYEKRLLVEVEKRKNSGYRKRNIPNSLLINFDLVSKSGVLKNKMAGSLSFFIGTLFCSILLMLFYYLLYSLIFYLESKDVIYLVGPTAFELFLPSFLGGILMSYNFRNFFDRIFVKNKTLIEMNHVSNSIKADIWMRFFTILAFVLGIIFCFYIVNSNYSFCEDGFVDNFAAPFGSGILYTYDRVEKITKKTTKEKVFGKMIVSTEYILVLDTKEEIILSSYDEWDEYPDTLIPFLISKDIKIEEK